MKDFNCKEYKTIRFSWACLLVGVFLIFSPVVEAKNILGEFPCFQIDVPNSWMRYQTGPAEWYYQAYLPGGAGIWLMLLVYNVDNSSQEKKQVPLTGSTPDGPDWLTGRVPLRTKSGEVWNCSAGIFPSGREHVNYSVDIYGPDGFALTAVVMILGTETFLRGNWTQSNIEFLRGILSSLRVTQKLQKCQPQKTGSLFSVPVSLSNLAMDGKRGYLGADLKNASLVNKDRNIPNTHLRDLSNDTSGVVFTEIFPGSPCVDAGIQMGDRILQADSRLVKNYTNLMQLLYWKNQGDLVKLHISRGGRSVVHNVRLAGSEDLPQESERQAGVGSERRTDKTEIPAEPEPAASGKISSLEIQGLKIEPAQVIGGEKFTFIVELTVYEADRSVSRLEVNMEHEILKDGKALYTGEPEKIHVPNGTPYRLKKSLNATRKTGLYEIRATLSYGDFKKTISSAFEIK